MKLEKYRIMDVGSTCGDIHHWEMPLFILILNFHVTLNKWKPYHSFLVAPNTISNENMRAIVTSSIHDPLAIMTPY